MSIADNYFKNNVGGVFAYDDEQVAVGLADDKTPMTPEEVNAHINPPATTEQQVEIFKYAIQAHMDNAAKGYSYDDIKAAVTYADEPAVPKFQDEGRAFRAWRSLVWAHAYGVLDAVQAGEREQPTIEELIVELPELLIEV